MTHFLVEVIWPL